MSRRRCFAPSAVERRHRSNSQLRRAARIAKRGLAGAPSANHAGQTPRKSRSSPANAYKAYAAYTAYNQPPMAKRAPSYRPKRLFAVGSLTPQSMTDNNHSVLESRLFVHECLVRHFVGHVGHVGQVGLYWCAAGTKKNSARGTCGAWGQMGNVSSGCRRRRPSRRL